MINKVVQFNKENNMELNPVMRVMDLTSECGEVSKEILLGTGYGRHEFEATDELAGEIGDMMYAIISLASESGLNAEECLSIAMAKYQKRIDKKKNMGSK